MRRELAAMIAGVAVLAGCGSDSGTSALDGDSRCRDLAALPADAQAQALLRVSKQVGAAHAGNPLWIGQITTYCTKLPDATLRAAFGRGDSEPDGDAAAVAAEAAPPFAADRTYRWDTEGESGSTATIKLALGEVTPASDAVPEDFAELTGTCDLDGERDAYLPIRLSVKNTTADFSLSPAVDLKLQNVEDRFQAAVRVDAATAFSDGPQCDAMSDGSIDDGSGVKFSDIAPEGENGHDWLLVIHDYYSPASPKGDVDGLAEWWTSVVARDETSTLTTRCFDAPADRYAFTGGFLRLGGFLSPGVPLADRAVDRNPDGDDDPPRCADADPGNDAPAGDMPDRDAACRELNEDARVYTTKTTLGATRRTFDRAGSMAQVCWGFGAPEELELSPGMQCALVAVAANAAAPAPGATAARTCDALAIQQAYETGDWAGEASGIACGYFGELVAEAGGIAAAGLAAPTGPAAPFIGVGTYKALSGGMGLACGGLFDGGAEAAGVKLEADHQRHVAFDIETKGKCLRETTLRGIIRWSAAKCPS